MKTALLSISWLDGIDFHGAYRLNRMIKFCNYYLSIQNELGFDKLILLDNGSKDSLKAEFLPYFEDIDFIEMNNLYYDPNIPCHYPHGWRTIYYMKDLIEQGYDKIIQIDSDGFIVSKKLANHIKNLNRGWTAFWCKRHSFPDVNPSVLCSDTFKYFIDYIKTPWEEHLGKEMERVLPFTHIEKGFNTDRFGEYENKELTSDMDYYGQMGPNVIPILQ